MARVLVIEDDRSILTGLVDALEQDGYDVLSSRDGAKGLELGLRESVDLVILDLMLPGMDGYEVCRKLREDCVNVPILILSARSREADKVVGLELGADDYVTKPFGVAELLARVKAALRRTRPAEDRKLKRVEIGPLALDFERYHATRSGKPLELTVREFAILAHFVRHRGKVVTREALLSAVWGHDIPPVTRTVDTHIATLRKKIERNPARPKLLVSVRGAGYRLDA